MLRRACRLRLSLPAAEKRHEIRRLLEAYRGAVNFSSTPLWQVSGRLDKALHQGSDDCVLHATVDEGDGRRSATLAFFRRGPVSVPALGARVLSPRREISVIQ
jgi:hypothetical protein